MTATGPSLTDGTPAATSAVVELAEVAHEQADVRRSRVHRVGVDRRAIDAAVVDQLEHVIAAGEAQHRLVQRRLGLADDLADVLLLVDALPDELEPEQVAVERERALEIGDLVAGVMGTDDGHDGSLIGTRKLRRNSQTCVLSWL